MSIQPVSFTSGTQTQQRKALSGGVDYKSMPYSRDQYKTESLVGSFFTGGLTTYTILNIFSTKSALRKIDQLPKEEIIKNVSKGFKKNIKWGLVGAVASAIVGHFWFDYTEPFCRKLLAKSEALEAEANATKELNEAIKNGDTKAQQEAIDKLNALSGNKKAEQAQDVVNNVTKDVEVINVESLEKSEKTEKIEKTEAA